MNFQNFPCNIKHRVVIYSVFCIWSSHTVDLCMVFVSFGKFHLLMQFQIWYRHLSILKLYKIINKYMKICILHNTELLYIIVTYTDKNHRKIWRKIRIFFSNILNMRIFLSKGTCLFLIIFVCVVKIRMIGSSIWPAGLIWTNGRFVLIFETPLQLGDKFTSSQFSIALALIIIINVLRCLECCSFVFKMGLVMF